MGEPPQLTRFSNTAMSSNPNHSEDPTASSVVEAPFPVNMGWYKDLIKTTVEPSAKHKEIDRSGRQTEIIYHDLCLQRMTDDIWNEHRKMSREGHPNTPIFIIGGMASGKTGILVEMAYRLRKNKNGVRIFTLTQIVEATGRYRIHSRNGRSKKARKTERIQQVTKQMGRRDVIIIDETQFVSKLGLAALIEEARKMDVTVIAAAIPRDLQHKVWPAVEQMNDQPNKLVVKTSVRCDDCGVVGTEMEAQLEDKSERREFRTLAAKNQWRTVCESCGRQYPPCVVYHDDDNGTNEGQNSPMSTIQENRELEFAQMFGN